MIFSARVKLFLVVAVVAAAALLAARPMRAEQQWQYHCWSAGYNAPPTDYTNTNFPITCPYLDLYVDFGTTGTVTAIDLTQVVVTAGWDTVYVYYANSQDQWVALGAYAYDINPAGGANSIDVPDTQTSALWMVFGTASRNNTISYAYAHFDPLVATAVPLSTQVCVAATPTPAGSRTPTPYAGISATPGGPTRTPTRTPTAGGPTATPGGTTTPTPATNSVQYDSATARFDTSLSPWTAFTGSPAAQWKSTDGNDARPGVAFMPYVAGLSSNPDGGMVFAKNDGFPNPVQVAGYFKSDTIYVDWSNYVNVWYLTTTATQTVWHLARQIPLTTNWQFNNAHIIAEAGETVTAIAINGRADMAGNYDLYESYTISGTITAGVYADDIRIVGGRDALRVCGQGSGNGNGLGTKTCVIRTTYTDTSTCIRPTGLDVPGWLSFWFCRLWYYLNFNKDNRGQFEAMVERQSANEPIGTLNELDDVAAVVVGITSDIGAINAANTAEYRRVDFSFLFDWGAIDTPPTLEMASVDVNAFMDSCSAAIRNVSQIVQQSACWSVSAVRNSQYPFLSIVQWIWDFTWVTLLFAYINTNWMWRQSGGSA